MPRSSVKTGLRDQRNRAQLRGKLDKPHSYHSLSPKKEMVLWLGNNIEISDVIEAEKVNLKSFLQDTVHLDLSPQERLRQLAIFLEPELSWSYRAWLALDRIYTTALSLSPDDQFVHRSRAISAQESAEYLEDTQAKKIWDIAWRSAYKAQNLAPTDVNVQYTLGSLCYRDTTRSVGEALQYFEAALAEDDNHQWARLYRAHCLQDLGKWLDAYHVYSQVKAAFFTEFRAWRYDLLLEQKAYCLWQSGDLQGATKEFKKLLVRWSADPGLAKDLMGNYITEAATGNLSEQLLADLSELVEREQWDWFDQLTL